MSKIVSSVLPIAGAVLGNFVLPGAGGFLGGALGGLGSGVMSGAGLGGDLMSAGLGALQGFGAQGLSAIGTGGAGGPLSILSSAKDPIEALSNAMTATGTSTATDAARALGFSSTNGMLAAANPSWLTPMASMGGQVSNLVNGLTGGGPPTGGFSTLGAGASPSTAMSSMLRGAGATAGTAAGASGVGPLSSLLSLASGAYGLSNAAQMQKLAEQAGASTRYAPQYAAQLSQLMQNPSSITSMPGYEAGMTAVERSMAAQGYQGSGNMAAALQQYGGNFFNSQVAQLQGLANPSGAGAAMSGMGTANEAASSALGALGYGVRGLGF